MLKLVPRTAWRSWIYHGESNPNWKKKLIIQLLLSFFKSRIYLSLTVKIIWNVLKELCHICNSSFARGKWPARWCKGCSYKERSLNDQPKQQQPFAAFIDFCFVFLWYAVFLREGNSPDQHQTITYNQLLKEVCRCANTLCQMGRSLNSSLYLN